MVTEWRRDPAVLWRSTSAGPIVLAPQDAEPERLGGLGAVVWELLDEPASAEAIERTIAEAADPPAPGVVAEALDALADLGLVSRPS